MPDKIVKTIDKELDKNIALTGAQRLVQLLEELGVEMIFGYPGAPILPIYDALHQSKIKHILCRHEQGAAMAAIGYAKVSSKAGVILVTSGPGFTNTITGILSAYSDGVPLILISGQVETTGENEFQDAEIEKISKYFAKKVYKINSLSKIEEELKLAFSEVSKAPMAPAVITVKKSLLKSQYTNSNSYRIKQEIKVEAPHSCVLKAIELLKNAERPLIIAGGGCKYCEQELREFANLTHIPIVNTLMGKGCADEVSLGFIGLSGNRYLSNEIENADVVLSLGTRFSNRTTINKPVFLPKSKIININIEHNKSQNVNIFQEITGELDIVLRHMTGVIKSKNILFDIKYNWIEQLSSAVERINIDTGRLTPESALTLIHEYTKKYRPIITTDVGEHQITAAKIFKTNSSKNFITSGGFGAMGFGLPTAIGAHLASPNSLIINITGDGSFQMNMQELGTLSQYNVPAKVIIINNSSLGMIKTLQHRKYNREYQSELLNPDFAQIAKSYGILGYRINTIEELKVALKEIFVYKKPVLLDIRVDNYKN